MGIATGNKVYIVSMMDDIPAAETPGDGAAPLQQRLGKRPKKKQKWTTLDMSSIPDVAPSAPAPGLVDRSQNSWSGNRGGGSGQGGSGQSYSNPGPRYNQKSDYAPRERGQNIALSKALVTLLRHGKPRDIKLDNSGFALVDEILQHYQFQKFCSSAKGIVDVVNSDNKNRFDLVEFEKGKYKVRATQGHSVKLDAESVGLTPLLDPKKYPTLVHGTYKEAWRHIKKDGLKRMTRTHVHFAIGYIGETQVTSGMRYSCDVVIVLDLEKAMRGGLKFYESANQVILCEGDQNGAISPKYFKQVKKFDQQANQFVDMNFVYE